MEEIKTLLALLAQFDADIEHSWQIFITVNTVIFGWLIAKKSQHELIPRITGVIAYAVFASAIFFSLDGDMALFEAAYADLKDLLKEKDNFLSGTNLGKVLIAPKNVIWKDYWEFIYIGSALVVAVLILADILYRKEGKGEA